MSDLPLLDGVGCVIVAAGQGTRLAAGRPKAFVELAGTTLLEHAVSRVLDAGVHHVVAVVPAALVTSTQELLAGRADVVAGGAERQDSVALGLRALPDGVDVVLVHDAARCLAPPSLVAAVVRAVQAGQAAVVPGLAVVDTLKEVDAQGTVVGTVAREPLRAVQTPQGFDRAVLQRAHAAADAAATDDAALVERLGEPVTVVAGDPMAFKITSPDDLALAEFWLARVEP
ncbi:MAG TPA: 2-C-methyl-D-erythritol 4-phosphate cytidylyltransferase [Angustibacter sp.]|nr:2-C-methyl-D-erythritol 4-phosphate cytidylyltransferase [Angustibacter sp.]